MFSFGMYLGFLLNECFELFKKVNSVNTNKVLILGLPANLNKLKITYINSINLKN